MYLEHFGLKEMPFRVTPSPRFAYPSMAARLASGKMQFAIQEQMGLAVVMGPSGSGKSTLCNALLAQFGSDPAYNIAYLPSLNDRGRAAVVKRLMAALGAPESKRRNYGDVVEEFQAYLINEATEGRHCVILLDEAQGVAAESLQVIGNLINFRTADQGFLTVLLFSLPSMPLKLRGANMVSFRSRIAIVSNLDALSFDEMKAMIAFRLQVAGSAEGVGAFDTPAPLDLFDESALKSIYTQTKGIPRDVCVLCGNALLEAFVLGQDIVTSDLVQHVVDEMRSAKKWPVDAKTTNEQLDKDMTGTEI